MLNTDLLSPKSALPPHNRWRIFLISAGSVVVIAGLLIGGCVGYYEYYKDKVYPGVYVADYALGTLTKTEVTELMETLNNRYAKEGVPLKFEDTTGVERRVIFNVVAGDAPEIIKLDSKKIADEAFLAGREDQNWKKYWNPVWIRFGKTKINGSLITDKNTLLSSLKNVLSGYEDQPHDAILTYKPGQEPFIQPAKEGSTFTYESIASDIETTVSNISFEALKISLIYRMPGITKDEIKAVIPDLVKILNYGSISFTHVDQETKARKEWILGAEQLSEYIKVEKDAGNIIFVLDTEKLAKYVETTISPEVNTDPKEAKFAMKDGKVESFQASRTGLSVDVLETVNEFAAAFKARNYGAEPLIKTVQVVAKIVEPTVQTAEVNSLGITELIGTGISTFKNSPSNRIKNIAHAVERLNGILIKPDEIFSANKAAGPYTLENGYLPEAVIKGTKITPEVGGGMCQVGTTIFRMAMNSGMPVTERFNHSLVVSYYADPVNGNPGTDATLYEPSLDLRFLNDTGNYLLLQTEIDYQKGELRFSLWGKSDGRKGSYTHPVVKRWIAPGEPQTTYVDDGTLAPGQEKCQIAYRGAVATFTYTRFTSSSEKIEQVYDSYYRPLPKICLIGAEPGTVCDGKLCAPLSAPSTTASVVR